MNPLSITLAAVALRASVTRYSLTLRLKALRLA
jgi:hypothetical protein